MRQFHYFYFFKFITALLFWCVVCWRFISVDNCRNPQVTLTLWPGPGDWISLCYTISHAGSHGEFHHVRQHDKRQDLICIHEALRKFKEKLPSSTERTESSLTVSVSDITISPSMETLIILHEVISHQWAPCHRMLWGYFGGHVLICLSLLWSEIVKTPARVWDGSRVLVTQPRAGAT